MTEKNADHAFAYTPGLKIKMSTLVEKERKLPLKGTVLVKVGDEVEPFTTVAYTTIAGDPHIVDAAINMGILPETLPEIMVKQIGEPVGKGDQLCEYKMLFGLIKRSVNCPINGTLESVSEITGRLIIRSEPIPVNMEAYIPGKIKTILPEEGAVIETNAAFIQGIFGISGERHGLIKVVTDSRDQPLTADLITEEHKDCIIVGGSLINIGAITKGIRVGVAGIVGGGINTTDLTKFMGSEVGVAITGEEKIGLTLIITEGFGDMSMHQKTYDILKKYEGHHAAMNGETQIRAGVIRPEIIIPHTEVLDTDQEAISAGMVSGTPIRIIRNPYFGAIGAVLELPVELQRLESGSKVRVLKAKLLDGSIVTVPRANVEIIEE
jgi:hypothetical protein